jgi:DNA-binding transcriptional LysR family regulator
MDRLQSLRLFLAVVDQGGFAAGARQQRVSAAAATRAVAAIEAELGVALFNRTTRSVVLTERGVLYAERCRAMLQDLEDAARLVRGEDAEPRGLLSLTAPTHLGRLHVLPIVETLLTEHPELTVRLTATDRVVHLVEEGFDAAFRIGALQSSALVALKLGEVRRVVVASPDYVARRGSPERPADLKQHQIVSFDGVGSTPDWRFGPSGRTSVTISARLTVNTADDAIDAVLRGGGITRLLSYQVSDALAGGELVRLLSQDEPPPIPVSIVYQASRRATPNITACLRETRRHFANVSLG